MKQFLLLASALLALQPSLAAAPAAGAREHVVKLESGDTLAAEFRVGTAGKVALVFNFADPKLKQTLTGVVKPDSQARAVQKDGKKATERVPMPEAFIEFTGAGLKFLYHARPRLLRYTEAQQAELAKTWAARPAASQAWVGLEVRADRAGAELWFDGRYCGRIASGSPLASVAFQLGAEGEVRGERTHTRTNTGLFLPLEVKHIARPGAMKSARVAVQKTLAMPMVVAKGADNVDVGEAKSMQGNRYLETDENTSRTSLDGMKESLHFSVPQEFYQRAWVLCAVEPDPKKDPVLTTRLTRFAVAGRGGAIADTTLTLPRGAEPPGPGIERVGSVDYAGADGRRLAVPLYLVRVDLKTGEILDLLGDRKDPVAAMKIGPYLDFEFLGKLRGLELQNDRRHKPLATSTSAVHVFGVTLEKSPIEMRLKQAQTGNVFHNDERPETTFALRANTAAKGALRWEITDPAGRVLARQERPVALAAAGSEVDITVPLAMPDLGWYGLRVTLADERGNALIKHDASFALLGKDTRTAGYESPFGTWLLPNAHYTSREASVMGPLFLKGGFRRTTMEATKEAESDFAPWKLSHNQVRWHFRLGDLNDWPAAEAKAEKEIRETLRRFPHCQYVLLFHEGYPGAPYPPELTGQKYVPKDAAETARDDKWFELGVKAAKFYRAKFPQLKIVVGNNGGSANVIAMLLRRGFPREYIDYLGSEAMGQTIAPEKLSVHTTGGIWLMGEVSRALGYGDLPMTGCVEFGYRCERDLGAQRHAEWYARDVLMGLAYRFPTITPATINDAGNAYYQIFYAGSGLCERTPLHYPKPAYVALATLTKALDSVKLVRQMPTGSSSARVLEFERGSERIYALWTPRGECEMKLEFPAGASVTQVEFYGRRQPLSARTVTASSAATYLISTAPATAITAGQRRFTPPPANTKVISRMDAAAQWQLATDELKSSWPPHRPGEFKLRQVADAEKGACLELELQRTGQVPAVVGEYTALRLNQPLPIPGQPHTVGVWVKGDSSWGRIMWEIVDAKGERWRSCRGGGDGDDWADHSAIDFDGWCFVTFPLTNDSPIAELEPNRGLGQWDRSGGDGKLDYPLKLVGLYVETHRQSLDLTQMKPVKSPIRLKDVSVIGGAP